ncbi:hypothetical protein [Kitasatospora sp. GAS204B]|uniref:hypothetical protein n=1 Tax=unclassified Kitasatospora TaxID=2633591 RepID=UPI002475354C|nr:hypothetical protein [Kitasatospora sp. GAS204B]MDH6119762.1 hypothetical protein [Kitasatospora sp. GAS204B]
MPKPDQLITENRELLKQYPAPDGEILRQSMENLKGDQYERTQILKLQLANTSLRTAVEQGVPVNSNLLSKVVQAADQLFSRPIEGKADYRDLTQGGNRIPIAKESFYGFSEVEATADYVTTKFNSLHVDLKARVPGSKSSRIKEYDEKYEKLTAAAEKNPKKTAERGGITRLRTKLAIRTAGDDGSLSYAFLTALQKDPFPEIKKTLADRSAASHRVEESKITADLTNFRREDTTASIAADKGPTAQDVGAWRNDRRGRVDTFSQLSELGTVAQKKDMLDYRANRSRGGITAENELRLAELAKLAGQAASPGLGQSPRRNGIPSYEQHNTPPHSSHAGPSQN